MFKVKAKSWLRDKSDGFNKVFCAATTNSIFSRSLSRKEEKIRALSSTNSTFFRSALAHSLAFERSRSAIF